MLQTVRDQNMDELILKQNKIDKKATNKRLLERQKIEENIANEKKVSFKRKLFLLENNFLEDKLHKRTL